MIRGLWEEMVQPGGVAHLGRQGRDKGPDGVEEYVSNGWGEMPRVELVDQQLLGKKRISLEQSRMRR
jgi:hypothetical protein